MSRFDELKSLINQLADRSDRRERTRLAARARGIIAEIEEATGADTIQEILGAAWSYEDKPHHLFSAVRRAALKHAESDLRAEIVTQMDAAYYSKRRSS